MTQSHFKLQTLNPLELTNRLGNGTALMFNAYNNSTLVQNLQVGVIVQLPDTKIVVCNPKALELLGLTEDQVLGKTTLNSNWNVIHEDGSDFPGSTYPGSRSIATGQQVRDVVMGVYRPTQNDRVWIHVNADPQLNSDGSVNFVVITFTDITSKHRAEVEKRRAEEWLGLAIDCSKIALWEWDIETGKAKCSKEWFEVLGYSLNEFEPNFQEWESRVHSDDLLAKQTATRSHLSNPDVKYDVQYRMRHKDGSWVWIHVRGKALRDVNGKPVTMFGCAIEITYRKKIEEQLHSANKRLESLSRQLISVRESESSHLARELHDELGQVLVAIKINTRRIQSIVDAKVSENLDEIISMIDQSLWQIRDISLNLRPLQLDSLGLVAALHGHANKQAGITGIPIKLRAETSEIQLASEVATVCFRIVQESITNAIKHAEPTRIEIEVRLEGRELRLTISDDGIGFDFNKALASSAQGGSFGLSGMHERVALLDGKLDVESSPGSGTRIQATFQL